jgi:hypothetical protein
MKTEKHTTPVVTEQPAAVVVEQPKPIVTNTVPTEKIKTTGPNDRQYIKNERTPTTARGTQRQIVLNILNAADKPLTATEIWPMAEHAGLKASGGVFPSVKYHLNLLKKENLVDVVNQTYTVPMTETVKVA